MELKSPQGHDLNEDGMLKWFHQALKRASKIPLNRFEGESGGGNLVTEASEMTRDEIKFHNFIGRLRSNFKEIIVKPLKMQMLIEFPELIEDDRFMNQMDIVFYSNQVFEEWKKLGNLEKKAGIVGTMLGVMNGEKPYFHIEYIMDHIFKLTPEEKAENARYWTKDATTIGSGVPGEGGAQGGGGDMMGGAQGGEMGGAQGGAQAPPAQGGAQAPPAQGPAQGGAQTPPPAQGGAEFEF
jgi:hypothetical protein